MAAPNLERYKKDLDALIEKGSMLHEAIQNECLPAEYRNVAKKRFGEKAEKFINSLPSFSNKYQSWYSESLALIRQLLPDRFADFAAHYEPPKGRKVITYESYRIADTLQGLNVNRTQGLYKEKVVGPDAGILHFRQQLAILESAKARFESSLFDIAQLVQADLFDSEVDAADHLAKQGFLRAAGALAGVVLERHLLQVAEHHKVAINKKHPGIADLNEALKAAGVIDIPQWRFNQLLADIRNQCDHNKKTEPSPEQIADLLAGVKKVTKSIF